MHTFIAPIAAWAIMPAGTAARRMSPRTRDASTFELRDGIIRWLARGGLPYAVVNRAVIPADAKRELDVVADFGFAVVAKRRGAASCQGT